MQSITVADKMKKLGMPFVCPSCGETLFWKSVDLVCINTNCGDKNVKAVASFLIKCGVENVTDTSLTNWGIQTFDDLLSFDPDTNMKSQDNFAAELVKNVFSKQKEELFSCMTFDGAGSTNINKIIDFYGQMDIIVATKVLYGQDNTQSEYPEGIGQKIIDKIKEDWIKNLRVLNDIIKDKRYNPKAKAVKATGNLSGMTFLLTGALTEKRSVVEKQITDAGGTIASSVSKTLSVLVCGPDSWGSSSKYVKAEKLGIKIITEDQLKDMF